jgi:hypothetical protein
MQVIAEDTTTTDGTEQTLATDTAGGVYVVALDTGAMVNGDTIEVRVKTKVRTGGTSRLAYYAVYSHAQGAPNKYSVPVPADVEIAVTLERTGGTDRAYPWKLLAL